MTLDVTESGVGRFRFTVRVQPRASSNVIQDTHNGALRVKLTAPPLDGRANEALIALLADRLGTRRAAIRLLAGERSRNKIVEVDGVSRSAVDALVVQPEE